MKVFLITLLMPWFLMAALPAPIDLEAQKPRDLQGRDAKVFAPQGKLLLVFWATWCPSCKRKMVSQIPKIRARGDLAVVAINTDEELPRAIQFVKRHKVDLEHWSDPEQKWRTLFGVKAVPHWVTLEKTVAGWVVRDQGTEMDESKALASLSLK